MIMLPCPWCGNRDASEFGYAGDLGPRPDVETATPQEWRQYLYVRANRRGWVTERWYHRAGCRRFVLIERDTSSDQVRERGQ